MSPPSLFDILFYDYETFSIVNKFICIIFWILCVEVAQSCPTLCDPMDCIHGILQARILEWVAFPSPGDLLNPGIQWIPY